MHDCQSKLSCKIAPLPHKFLLEPEERMTVVLRFIYDFFAYYLHVCRPLHPLKSSYKGTVPNFLVRSNFSVHVHPLHYVWCDPNRIARWLGLRTFARTYHLKVLLKMCNMTVRIHTTNENFEQRMFSRQIPELNHLVTPDHMYNFDTMAGGKFRSHLRDSSSFSSYLFIYQ